MARKPSSAKKPVADIVAKPAAAPVTHPNAEIVPPIATTAVRKTVAPKPAAPAKKAPAPVTYERIAERAYYISQSGYGGSEDDNWLRAENELKGEGV